MKYVGARYMPKFMIPSLHDPSIAYEALSVVDNGMGTSYVSNKPVPVGIPLTDTTYWAVYGASSGAILDLQNRVGDLETYHSHIKVINVLDIGLDNTGVDDCSALLQQAITDNGNQCAYYFPKGHYNFESTVTIKNSAIKIYGDGRGESFLVSSIAAALFKFDTTDNRIDVVEVRDLSIQWHSTTAPNTGSIGIQVTGDNYFNHSLFDNIVFWGIETAFYCDKRTTGEEILFNFNTFAHLVTTNHGSNFPAYAFNFVTGSGTGNLFVDCSLTATVSVFNWECEASPSPARNIGDILINSIQMGGDGVSACGITIDGTNARYHNQIVVTNCQFDAGIVKAFSFNTMDTITVSNCNLSDQWSYDVINCTHVAIDYGRNNSSKFSLVNKATTANKAFGKVTCMGKTNIYYKAIAYGMVDGVGERFAFEEGQANYSQPKTVISSSIPDTTNFNLKVTVTQITGGIELTFEIDHAGANSLPVYLEVETVAEKATIELYSTN